MDGNRKPSGWRLTCRDIGTLLRLIACALGLWAFHHGWLFPIGARRGCDGGGHHLQHPGGLVGGVRLNGVFIGQRPTLGHVCATVGAGAASGITIVGQMGKLN